MVKEKITIITLDEAFEIASIYTSEEVWQKHLEDKLGLSPTFQHISGARGYDIPKDMIKMPVKE